MLNYTQATEIRFIGGVDGGSVHLLIAVYFCILFCHLWLISEPYLPLTCQGKHKHGCQHVGVEARRLKVATNMLDDR